MNLVLVSIFAVLLFISLSYFSALSSTQSILVTAVISIILERFQKAQKHPLPPGPYGLPVIGCLLWIIRDRNGFLMKMYQKYGPMFTLRLGRNFVVINNYEMIKEFTNHPDCQFRSDKYFIRRIVKGRGIISAEGALWKHQRRFAIMSLRDNGMGKVQMNEKISKELSTVVKIIAERKCAPMSFSGLLKKSTSNIMFNVAFSKSYDYDDPFFTEQLNTLDEHIILIGQMVVLSHIPFLSPLIDKKVQQTEAQLNAFFRNADAIVEEHRRSFDPNDLRDLADLFLNEMSKESSDDDKEYLDTFTEDQLRFVIVNLFVAGTETSSTTILWALYYLALHREIQSKVQAELDEVVGKNRNPVLHDRQNLPYTVAALQEVERMASVVPGGLSRSNERPVKFNGYTFPTRTAFIMNYHAVHHDPLLWKDPDRFSPERFISPDGKVFRPAYLLPFGSGKRNCAGEVLARSEIFLYFSTLFLKFRYEPVSRKELLSLKNIVGLINIPAPFKLIARARF